MNKVINPLQFKQQVMELLYQPAPSSPDLTQLLPELKRAIVEEVLIHTYGNQTRAAAILGINRETLRRLYLQKKSRSVNQPRSCKNNDVNDRTHDPNI
ncbi:helix-turn-helix domain-containing protein [Vibrio parahaemolyticus]|nr:helix-turn-helix domain-containing protein [Vibrio parahaemolyticus]